VRKGEIGKIEKRKAVKTKWGNLKLLEDLEETENQRFILKTTVGKKGGKPDDVGQGGGQVMKKLEGEEGFQVKKKSMGLGGETQRRWSCIRNHI